MSNHAHVGNAQEVDIEECKAEVEKLRAHKKTLEGKIQGYSFLGNRLREKDEECRQLKQKLAEVTQNTHSKTDNRPVTPQNTSCLTSTKNIQTSLHLMNDIHVINTSNGHPYPLQLATQSHQASANTTGLIESGTKQSSPIDCLIKAKSTNIVNMSSNHTTVETIRLFPSETKPAVYGPPGDGVAYPPVFVRRESEVLQNYDKSHPIQGSPTDAQTESCDQTDGLTKGAGSLGIQIQKDLKSYDVPNETSLNLMNFEDSILYPPTDFKKVPVDDSAVDQLISMQVRADLVTDGPSQNIKKYVEDHLLPMLQKQEEETKRKEERWKSERCELLQKIEQLEMPRTKNQTPGQSFSENQMPGWDVVQRNEAMKSSDVRLLEEHNKQLVDANRSWQAFYEKTQTEQQKTADHYKEKFEALTQEISRMKVQDEQKKADFQKILFESKQKQADEEALKEEMQHYKGKAEALERQLQQIHPGVLQNNMNALHIAGTSGPPEFNITNGRSLRDLQVENETLRCQLTVFQEDFDRERSDRAQAQAAKENFKEELDAVKQECNLLRNQMKQNERNMRQAQSNCREAHREKDNLQQEIRDLKNTLRREKEANAMHLQRPFPAQIQPVPQHQGYLNHPGGMVNGTPHIEPSRVAAQPQTDPFAQPIPSYMANTHQRSSGVPQPQKDMSGEWQCNRCTVNNHPSRTVCEVCGYKQPFAQQRPGYVPPQLYRTGYNGDQMEPCESFDLSTDTGDLAQD
ncbi:TNFAIP3-interacting protein 1-like [Ylistrum balloti]|uniref:TNFAIP3-interacting protein 1-like n=1 Tax=Ylistrum balloti TaxID=509963 RepID=UPI002905D023|nr:TNFAIP3-interacting protein 1-like [Ylistrum balloti]